MPDIARLDNEAYLIVDGIAFTFTNDGVQTKLLAVNTENPVERASFIHRASDFIMSVSTFPNEERLLCFVERNKNFLAEGLRQA